MKIPQTKQYSIYKKLVLQDNRSKKLNFNSDGRKHYVYRVTDYTRNEKQHYYGSRTSKKDKIIEDFWNYKTSSKYNTLNENKKENYKVKIIKVFDNPGDKILYEAFLHRYFNVKLHNSFWNESNQTPFGYDTTGKTPWNNGLEGIKGRCYNLHERNKVSNRMRKWCNEKVTNENGEISTNAIERNKKTEMTRNEVKLIDGEITSIAILSGKKSSKTKRKNSKKYILKNVFNNSEREINAHDLRKISQTLHLKTKENYVGKSIAGRTNLNRLNKLNLVGCYVEEIK